DLIISKLNGSNPDVDVVREIGRNMIEFGAYPDVPAYSPSLSLINSLEKAYEVCRSNDVMMYPFACYPGAFEPSISKAQKYKIKKDIFGIERIKISCRVTGFHHHYALPKGVFDLKKRKLRVFKKSKLKRAMVSSYNFEVAADPALTLFAQSSPFYQGNFLGKDSRLIVYRGGKKLKYADGLYAKLQQLGGLPPYKQTATDLINSLKKRWRRWELQVKKVAPSVNFDKLYPYKLDIGWNPVKINKHGTLEQRGMDMNFPSVLVAITVLLKFCLGKIQTSFIEVLPTDFGIEEAFKIEGRNMYIPPHTPVRNKLQFWSAYKGFDKKEIYQYTKRFFNFAKSITPKKYMKVILPLQEMVESKCSVSDKILRRAKYKGYLSNGSITNKDAAELAIHYSEEFSKDIAKTKEMLEELSQI
ncbi:MAG: hypothetical protein U9O94_01765, partial [Nanoarchaeota archaeon]|nr:hypothetical protein [Nanoarchaeota archaeon]